MTANIVLLNGVGSVGKSSIAKALQNITQEPYLHLEMDAFLAMLPEAWKNHPDGLSFETSLVDGKPSVFAKTGPVAEQTLSGMRRAVAAMASAGNNLIVDDVLFGNVMTGHGNAVADYKALLAPYRVYWVGLFASLETLEKREQARGDRTIGLARWQVGRVHTAMDYDLEIDTDTTSTTAAAQTIKEQFGL